MSKPVLDSDLYGDIYADEFSEFLDPTEDELSGNTKAEELEDTTMSQLELSNLEATNTINLATSSHGALRSLPAKPTAPTSKPPLLSYSAQVAKQFSTYQQTPSQERQQRFDMASASSRLASAHPSNEQVASSASDSVFGKKPSEMHDDGKMFIGGLNWDTTDESLRDYFSQFGKVDACTIMRDPAGTSRGFAFLTFEDQASVDTVLAREHSLDGKAIDPKRAIPREEHLRNTRYFVGGLSHSTTSESMRNFFSAYGKVVDATMMVDRETGRSKGFGFVTFEDASNADQLVGNQGLTLDDKQIEVKLAQPRSQRDQTRSLVNKIVSNRESSSGSDPDRQLQTNVGHIMNNQVNPMTMMYSRPMNQMSMMGNPMAMMNMNPMMTMGIGMNPYLSIGNGMPVNGMPGMNLMNGTNGFSSNGMGNGGAMRLGMGPIGNVGMLPPGMIGIGGIGSMGANMFPTGMASMAGTLGRMGSNSGLGPIRMANSNKKQHSFHPYAR